MDRAPEVPPPYIPESTPQKEKPIDTATKVFSATALLSLEKAANTLDTKANTAWSNARDTQWKDEQQQLDDAIAKAIANESDPQKKEAITKQLEKDYQNKWVDEWATFVTTKVFNNDPQLILEDKALALLGFTHGEPLTPGEFSTFLKTTVYTQFCGEDGTKNLAALLMKDSTPDTIDERREIIANSDLLTALFGNDQTLKAAGLLTGVEVHVVNQLTISVDDITARSEEEKQQSLDGTGLRSTKGFDEAKVLQLLAVAPISDARTKQPREEPPLLTEAPPAPHSEKPSEEDEATLPMPKVERPTETQVQAKNIPELINMSGADYWKDLRDNIEAQQQLITLVDQIKKEATKIAIFQHQGDGVRLTRTNGREQVEFFLVEALGNSYIKGRQLARSLKYKIELVLGELGRQDTQKLTTLEKDIIPYGSTNGLLFIRVPQSDGTYSVMGVTNATREGTGQRGGELPFQVDGLTLETSDQLARMLTSVEASAMLQALLYRTFASTKVDTHMISGQSIFRTREDNIQAAEDENRRLGRVQADNPLADERIVTHVGYVDIAGQNSEIHNILAHEYETLTTTDDNLLRA